MAYKVHVKGFANNRTVEGVLNAYTLIHPNCSLADINKAFPASIHSTKLPILGTKEDFDKSQSTGKLQDDYMKIKINYKKGKRNCKTAYMLQMWSVEDTQKLMQYATKEDIDITDFKKRQYFVPGSYSLTYVNGWKPGKSAPKPNTGARKSAKGLGWLIVLSAIILAVLLFFLFRHLGKEKEATIEKVAQVETAFNAVQFAHDSYALSVDAQLVLDKLAGVMLSNELFTLRVEGHTSKEGDDSYNQRLSEHRAKATCDYLVAKGVAQERVEYAGMGSSKPIDETRLAPNRRTEFILNECEMDASTIWGELKDYVKELF